MTFADFTSAQSFYLWSIFGMSLFMGAVVNKTNFCTMGAVSDLVNMGDTGRLRAWLLAGTVALLGVTLFEFLGLFDLSSPGTGQPATLPPYRGVADNYTFPWGRFVLGGFLFGIGMTFGSGCGNKTLIRIGGGNIKSILVFLLIMVIAYYMVDPFKQLEVNWYQAYFQPWLDKASFQMKVSHDFGSIAATLFGSAMATTKLIVGLLVGGTLLFLIFRSSEFRRNFDNVFAGVVIGLAVLGAWYITANINLDIDGDQMSMRTFVGEQWEMIMDSDEGKPKNASTNLLPTSYTFISPIGQTLGYAKSGFSISYLTFGVISVIGVILGSLLWALISKGFRIEWFASWKDFFMHTIGGILMGFGGVLGMGCTVGQGISGVSTLAVGSFLTLISIIFGSALTMKIQYYKLVYEDEASFGSSLITALVDMKLLPSGMRKLEAV
ncbi:MAG TPA: YeeE/YedE family protein [Gammaproteobacteria bacterium]|nr:YeeE/YedE family protein [Gammaproteobacteria bacterium]